MKSKTLALMIVLWALIFGLPISLVILWTSPISLVLAIAMIVAAVIYGIKADPFSERTVSEEK